MKRKRFLAVALSLSMLWGEVSNGVSFITQGITALAAESKANHYSLVEKTSAMKYKGDVNGDGKITDDDKTLLQKWLVHMVNDSELDLEKADLNLDGEVTIRDFVELSILCGSTQISDGEGEYENVYTPEPRARVICNTKENNKEKIETKMTEEMADLVDHLKTPLAVYEYLYNNVNVEFYTGSRKGAIGAYEQNGGNDVDCASLLIAMLRYLGYDAEYVTGSVGYTAQQIIDLTAADDIETALKIFTLGNKTVSKSADTYYFDHTWVKTSIDGKEFDLDISFKKYKQIESIADQIQKQNLDVNTDILNSPVNAYTYLSKFNNSNEDICVNVTGKEILRKKIAVLPESTSYLVGEIKETKHNIIESNIITTDALFLGFNGEYHKPITAPQALISTISIGYVPNDKIYEYFGDGSKPSSIYNLGRDYLASAADSLSPALYIDNQNIYEWNSALTSLGKKQVLSIRIRSNNSVYEETKELIVGSVNAIVTDTQAISGQELYTAYEAMPLTDTEKAKVNENTVFKDEYIGNLLHLIGDTYFMQLDLENKTLAGANSIYIERTLSYGIFTYDPKVTTRYSQVEIEKNGSYGVDIIGNIYSTISYNNDTNAENNYRFASGYISSYLESLVLEQILGTYSVSTARIFELASAQNIDFKVFAAQNENELDSLSISDESKNDIHEAISNGNKVIIPAKNISIGSWSGTGYIIMGDDGYSFMISNGSHGGYTVTDLSVYYSINVVIAGDAMFHVLYGMISASVTMFMTGNFIGGAIMLGASIALTYMLMDYICDCTDLYFAALDGNEAAANQLNFNAFISTVGFLSQPLVEPIAEGLSSVKAPECVRNAVNSGNDWILGNSETYRRFVMMGYSDELVSGLFQDSRCFLYGDDFIENVLKSGDAHGIMSSLAKCPDEIISAVSSSAVKDALPSFISNYGDDGAKVLCYCGDDIVTCLERIDDTSAREFIKIASENCDETGKLFHAAGDDAEKFIKLINDNNGISFKEVEVRGSLNTELDELDFANHTIFEDKNASGLYMDNPDVPQTEQEWAKKQIYKKGKNRIEAITGSDFKVAIDGEEYNYLSYEIKNIKNYTFRINADTLALRIAVEQELNNLRAIYPDYTFDAIYGV